MYVLPFAQTAVWPIALVSPLILSSRPILAGAAVPFRRQCVAASQLWNVASTHLPLWAIFRLTRQFRTISSLPILERTVHCGRMYMKPPPEKRHQRRHHHAVNGQQHMSYS